MFIALAGAAKAIVSYRVGKRTMENTQAFLWDVRERVFGAPEISSDGFPAYPAAVEDLHERFDVHGHLKPTTGVEPRSPVDGKS